MTSTVSVCRRSTACRWLLSWTNSSSASTAEFHPRYTPSTTSRRWQTGYLLVTSAEAEVMWSVRFVCHSVSVCVMSVCGISAKVSSRFHWNLALWLRLYQLEELINIWWWWSGSRYGFQITFALPSPLQNRDFRRFISIYHTVTGWCSQQSARWLTLTT